MGWATKDRSHICTDVECVGQLELQVGMKTKESEKRKNNARLKIKILFVDQFSWKTEYSWTRANRGNLIDIIKYCDIFVFSVCSFFPHLLRVSAGHKYLYFLFFVLPIMFFCLFLGSSGCKNGLALLLFDIVGHSPTTYVRGTLLYLSVAFSWMSIAL